MKKIKMNSISVNWYNFKCPSTCITGILKGERKKTEKIFEDIMAPNA